MLKGQINVYRAFSHDVTAAMLVFQNKGMAAMMVFQTNVPGIGHFRVHVCLLFKASLSAKFLWW